ncbi:MAG: LysM peptidoglycan-binding domain-containing protein [Cytophagaceae bacterium]
MKNSQRISVFLTIFLLLTISSFAQKKDKPKKTTSSHKEKVETQIADRYFATQEYYLAAKEYELILKQDPNNKYAIFQLGECYRLHFDYDQAEAAYKRAVDTARREYPLSRYWYASVLKLNGKYGDAEENYQLFLKESATNAELDPYKEKAVLDLNGCQLALNEMKKPARDYEFHLLKGPVNTENSDYSPSIFENDSSIAIASARKESTGDNEYGRLGGKFSDMYRFKKTKDSWVAHDDKDVFSILHTDRNESPGSFTKDHHKFYFTRCDEPVTKNGIVEYECAIYMSKLDHNKWTAPVKLNENINMPGEWNAQPSISPKGDTLYFVSKRPGGLGMHDIWFSTCHNHDDNWGAPVNLGDKINTPYIDMSPCYYSKEKTLFFASNGHEGFGGLDIFLAKGNGLSEVRNVSLPFNSNRDDFYFVLGEKSGYLSSNREGGIGNDDVYKFNIHSKELLIAAVDKDSLGDAKSISVEGIMQYDDTHQAAKDVEVFLTDKTGKVIKSSKTDDEGAFRFDNLPPGDYKVIMRDSDPRLTAQVKYITDKVGVKSSDKVASKTLFENIYFDYDKYVLRPEAKKTLDDLIAYYKKNPEVQIEMNANTDSYGSDAYNAVLSNNRGKYSVDYLLAGGVKKNAIVVTAQGEGKPLASNENQIGRQLNRRVEFYIIGGPGYVAKAMTYVIEPKNTLASVAKKFNMSVDEVKALNGIDGNELTPYSPLRVRRTGDSDIIAPVTIAQVDTHNRKIVEKEGTVATFNPTHVNPNQVTNPDQDYYVVEPKNTVYSISKQFGMTPEELKELNGLKSNKIGIGQRLRVKKGAGIKGEQTSGQYVVKEGDTMYSISKRFGMTVDELKDLNGLKTNRLLLNMVLKVKK